MKNFKHINKNVWPGFFLVTSAICWAVVAFSMLVYSTDGSSVMRSVGYIVDVSFIIARVFLVIGVILAVFVSATKHRYLLTAGAIAAITIGFIVFQIHENQIKKNALNECLALYNNDPDSGLKRMQIENCYRQ